MTDQQDDSLKQIIALLNERLPRSVAFGIDIPDLAKIVSTLSRIENELRQMSGSLRLVLEKLEAKEQTKE